MTNIFKCWLLQLFYCAVLLIAFIISSVGSVSKSCISNRNSSTSAPDTVSFTESNRLPSIKIVISVSINEKSAFNKWLSYFLRTCSDTSLLHIICLDGDVKYILSNHLLICSNLTDWKNSSSYLWLYRTNVTSSLLQSGFDVLLSDLDALWLKNPFDIFNRYNSSQILGTRARFPEATFRRYGSAFCLGFLLVRAGDVTVALWQQLLKDMSVYSLLADDQLSFNVLLEQWNMRFINADKNGRVLYVGSTSPDYAVITMNQPQLSEKARLTRNQQVSSDKKTISIQYGHDSWDRSGRIMNANPEKFETTVEINNTYSILVTLLPHRSFPRSCMMGVNPRNAFQRGEVVILHCSKSKKQKKIEAEKEAKRIVVDQIERH